MDLQEHKRTRNVVCYYLGLEEDRHSHSSTPTDRHRCYLWGEGVRLDLDLQDRYCLSDIHSKCPWSSVGASDDEVPAGPAAVALSMLASLADEARTGLENSLPAAAKMIQLFERAAPVLRPVAWVLAAAARFAKCLLLAAAAWVVQQAKTHGPALAGKLLPVVQPMMQWSWRRLGAGLSFIGLSMWRMATRSGRNLAGTLPKPAARAGSTAQAAPTSGADVISIGPPAAISFQRSVEADLAARPSPGESSLLQEGYAGGVSTAPGPELAASQFAQAGQPAQVVDRTLSEYVLLERGVEALNGVKEDLARAFFMAATELHPDCLEAWLWRSKTALELPELIGCLQKALSIDPDNKQVQANLDWALQRHQREQERIERLQQQQAEPAAEPPANDYRRVLANVMWYGAGLASLVLSILWLAAGVAPILGLDATLGGYLGAKILPILDFPSVPASNLELYRQVSQLVGYVPDFNLLALVPLVLGTLFMLVGDGLFARRKGAAFWLVVAFVGGAVSLRMYPPGTEALIAVSTLGTVALLGVSLGLLLGGDQADDAEGRMVARREKWSTSVH